MNTTTKIELGAQTDGSFIVPAGYEAHLAAAVAKLNARATKKGFLARPFVIETSPVRLSKGDVAVRVVFNGPAPTVEGFRMIARIEHTPAGNLIHALDYDVDLSAYREAKSSNCDHCGTRRYRLDTYILRDRAGNFRQIGRNCLADYIGGDPAAALRLWDLIVTLRNLCLPGEEGWGLGYAPVTWEPAEFLAVVSAAIRTHGWRSRSKARDLGGDATVDFVLHYLRVSRKADRDERLEPTEADHERAAKTIAWIESIPADTDSDYLHNLRVMSELGYVNFRNAGIMAAAVASYNRAMEIELERAKRDAERVSGTVGKPGEKLSSLPCVVVQARCTQGTYGPQTLVKFRLSDGKELVWWASADVTEKVPVGATGQVSATVKKHDDYKGFMSTVVTRANFKSVQTHFGA